MLIINCARCFIPELYSFECGIDSGYFPFLCVLVSPGKIWLTDMDAISASSPPSMNIKQVPDAIMMTLDHRPLPRACPSTAPHSPIPSSSPLPPGVRARAPSQTLPPTALPENLIPLYILRTRKAGEGHSQLAGLRRIVS